MANHKSALKRIRQNIATRMANRFFKKTTRTAIAKLREINDKADAQKFMPKVIGMIDHLAKRRTWHKNKAANLKSSLMRHVAGLK
ncbi:MAG TPA: 30S ribosomal protein S20 [Saprospiraceae bacterium]|nr:30S ribosomal protein S20 [Saprospiraceae bacterium]